MRNSLRGPPLDVIVRRGTERLSILFFQDGLILDQYHDVKTILLFSDSSMTEKLEAMPRDRRSVLLLAIRTISCTVSQAVLCAHRIPSEQFSLSGQG